MGSGTTKHDADELAQPTLPDIGKLVSALEGDDPVALRAALNVQHDTVWRHATATLCLRQLGVPVGVCSVVCGHLPFYSPPELELRIQCEATWDELKPEGREDAISFCGRPISSSAR